MIISELNLVGCGFTTKQSYRFGWFSMKLKLVGGDSAGVVTAYYVSTDFGGGVYYVLWTSYRLMMRMETDVLGLLGKRSGAGEG